MTENRYSRQILFASVGEGGQRKIAEACVAIVGCGALGTTLASLLCRAGVGRLKIADRDFVEETNLQRQALFTEDDARQRLPKAVAAVQHLRQINSSVALEAAVTDVNPRNVESLLKGSTLVLDATDNLETRFLINDVCVKNGTPWVYGGAVGSTGMVMPVLPGQTPCLRCFMEELPPAGALPTCDRAGVLNATPGTVASLQAAAALRILVGQGVWPGPLVCLDVWKGEFRSVTVSRRPDCPACGLGRFEFLDGKRVSWATSLCGRNMVQIVPPEDRCADLAALAGELSKVGEVTFNGHLLTLRVPPYELILFPTGRALIKGAANPVEARSIYVRYVGN